MKDDHVGEHYLHFLNLVKNRHTSRRFKPDAVPGGYPEKILEAARWAMSGGNAQPWEFVIVRKPETIKALYEAYQENISKYNFCLEQMLRHEFRHPAFQMDGNPENQLRELLARPGWSLAPVLIAVLGDGRRQWASVSGCRTPGRGITDFSDGLANVCQIIHLAASALGLASQWVTIHIKEPFKEILGVPGVLSLHSIIPIGYSGERKSGSYRRRVEDMVHYEAYDRKKYMSDQEIVEYIRQLRGLTKRTYARSRGDV